MVIEKFDLESWRKGLHLSKLKAAKKIGVDKNVYNKYEREGVCPRTVRLAAVAIGLGMT